MFQLRFPLDLNQLGGLARVQARFPEGHRQISGNRKADPDFVDRLELLISHLDFLLEVARDRLYKA